MRRIEPTLYGRLHAVEQQGEPARRCVRRHSRCRRLSSVLPRLRLTCGSSVARRADDLEEAVAGARREPRRWASPAPTSQRGERVGAEVLLHDELGACRPGARRASQRRAAARAARPCRSRIGGFDQMPSKRDVGRAPSSGAASGVTPRRRRRSRRWRRRSPRHRATARSLTSTAQTVGVGRPPGERDGDRAVAAAEVEQRRRAPGGGRGASSSRSLVPGSTRVGRRRRPGRWSGRASTSGRASAHRPRRATATGGRRIEVVAGRRPSGGCGAATAATVALAPWPPTRSGSSVTPCCGSGRPRSPTSTARWSGSSTTCSRPCTTPPASAWPPRRSACRSASSSTTSTTSRACSSTPRSSRADGEWAYDEGCLSVPGLSFEIVRPERDPRHRARPRRQRGRPRGRRARRPACSSTSSTTSTASCCVEHLDDDQRKEAEAPSASCACAASSACRARGRRRRLRLP